MNDLNERGEFILEKEERSKILESFSSESMSDKETKLIINEIYNNQKMFIDPHTAVGIGVTKKILLQGNTIILSTAHPSKFSDVIMKETNAIPELPKNLENVLTKKEKYKKLPKDLKIIQNYILERI